MSKFIKFESVSYEDTKSFGSILQETESRQLSQFILENKKRGILRLAENLSMQTNTVEADNKRLLTVFDVIPPITVNTLTKHVIDGQYRLKAFQSLIEDGRLASDTKIKVMWVEIPLEEEKKPIIEPSTPFKKWTWKDYLLSDFKTGRFNERPFLKKIVKLILHLA